MIERLEEVPDVGIEHPAHRLPPEPDRQRIQGHAAAPWSESVGEPDEGFLVEAVSTSTTARWTILSSSTGTLSGLSRPSVFGM